MLIKQSCHVLDRSIKTKLFSIFEVLMQVEIEDIALFGLFIRGGKTMQILEKDFSDIEMLVKELSPIALDYQKLYRLGFIRNGEGTVYRQYGTSQFFLRALKDGKWEFYLNGGDRIRILTSIHQVQRLWFDLFDDHLFLPRGRMKKQPEAGKLKSGSFQRRH